jgi:hypothetical protein
MKKQNLSVSGGERAAAALDRSTWLNWSPTRGGQMAIAMVDALLRAGDPQGRYTGDVGARIAMNVRTMR